MSRKREIETMPELLRTYILMDVLASALRESGPRATDTIGIACNYGHVYGVRRSDFDSLLDKTVRQIVNDFDRAMRRKRRL